MAGTQGVQGLRPGAAARLSPCGIIIDDGAAFVFDDCAVWRAPAWQRETSRAASDAAYESLARRCVVDAPEGLAPVVFGASIPVTSFTRSAASAVLRFQSWLSAPWPSNGEPEQARFASSGEAPVRGLVGLGPGLTPSGDDFLCGALAMLDALGEHAIQAALAHAVGDAAPAQTSPLAACLLRAAAAGHVGERLHDVVSALLVGDAAAAAAAARRIGHSSGWDMLAGAATVARMLISVNGGGRSRRPISNSSTGPALPPPALVLSWAAADGGLPAHRHRRA
jgi:hypothetical protein